MKKIKDTASAHRFKGVYEADELTWFTEEGNNWDGWSKRYGDAVAAKYTARAIVMHLGMDVAAGIGSALLFDSNWRATPEMVGYLSTILAGAKAIDAPVKIISEASDIVSYVFSMPDGSTLIAYWRDGMAKDDDPGMKASLSLPGMNIQDARAMDIMNGFEQELEISDENGAPMIQNLLIKDYPIIIVLK